MKKIIILFIMLVIVLPSLFAQTAIRKTLLEFFSTEKCPYCPGGAVKVANVMKNAAVKDKVIWVTHHVGMGTDFLTVSESNDFTKFLNGTPTYMLDRTPIIAAKPVKPLIVSAHWATEALILTDIQQAIAKPTFVTVNISQNYVADSKIHTVTVSGEYIGTLPTDALYLNIYLVEDGITSTTQGGFSGTYTHNNALRKVTTAGSIGTKITFVDNKFNMSASTVLNSIWKPANMKVVAFISKALTTYTTDTPSNLYVLNAQDTLLSLNSTSSIDLAYENSLTAYASHDEILIQGKYNSFEVYNVNGAKLANKNLSKGIYIVRIENSNKKTVIKKVVV